MEHNEILRKISELKINLENTDYKIIKCYEASLLGEDMPYDLNDILNERKIWRNEINNLEFELAMSNSEKIIGPDREDNV